MERSVVVADDGVYLHDDVDGLTPIASLGPGVSLGKIQKLGIYMLGGQTEIPYDFSSCEIDELDVDGGTRIRLDHPNLPSRYRHIRLGACRVSGMTGNKNIHADILEVHSHALVDEPEQFRERLSVKAFRSHVELQMMTLDAVIPYSTRLILPVACLGVKDAMFLLRRRPKCEGISLQLNDTRDVDQAKYMYETYTSLTPIQALLLEETPVSGLFQEWMEGRRQHAMRMYHRGHRGSSDSHTRDLMRIEDVPETVEGFISFLQ
jgi:hypothetical protein